MARIRFETSPLNRRPLPPGGRERVRRPKHATNVAVFLPDHLDTVRLIAMRGASDSEIAAMFGVTEGAFARWRAMYKDFNGAIEKGRTHADAEVVVSLYKRAVGYDYTEEVVAGKDPEVFEVSKHSPPDVGAIQYWLNNRQHEFWGSKSRTEHSGVGGGPIGLKAETKSDIIDAIVGLITPKPDDELKPKKPERDRARAA